MAKRRRSRKDRKPIAERLREERLQRGLLQSDVAEQIGVPINTVSRWELGMEPRGLNRRAVESWLGKEERS